MARTDPQVNFRMPQELRDKLEDASKANKRTLTAEIVDRLESSFALPGKIDSIMEAYQSGDAAHDEEFALTERLIQMYETQKALSDLQQGIIDQLLKAQGSRLVTAAKKDMPNPAEVFEQAVQAGESDDPIVRKEQERRGIVGSDLSRPSPATPEKPQDPPKDAAKPADTAGKLNAAAKSWEGEKFAHLRKAPPARKPREPASDTDTHLPAAARKPPDRK